jgi:large subunit ribosomal protein L31
MYPTLVGAVPTLMKAGIHPNYHPLTVNCACGHSFTVGSTLKEDKLRVEICSNCHPLYTGKSKLIDTTGRVDRFQMRQQKAQEMRGIANTRLEKQDGVTEAAPEQQA